MKNFFPLKNPSPWRRISLANWKTPNDSTVYGVIKVEATPLLQFLERINAQKKDEPKITITHAVAQALALTLRAYPDLNGIIRWGKIYLRESVDIFLQVAVAETASGEKPDLSGAKVMHCDTKSLSEIALDLTNQSVKIRKKDDPQFQSSHRILKHIPTFVLSWVLRFMTFLVYNLGLSFPKLGLPEDPFGSAMVTSVGSLGVPPGFAPLVPISRVPLILCVGAIETKPWVMEDKVEARPVLEINVTLDHRFIDGLVGSRMYKQIKQILNEPEKYLC